MTYNGSDRKQVRAMEKEAEIVAANRLVYVRRIMSDVAGRKWMHDLLTKGHIWSTAFVAGSPDTTAFRLGEQNICLQVFSDVVSAAPDDYVVMMNEAYVKELVHERRYSDDRATGTEQLGSEDAGRDVEGRIDTEYDPYARTDN